MRGNGRWVGALLREQLATYGASGKHRRQQTRGTGNGCLDAGGRWMEVAWDAGGAGG